MYLVCMMDGESFWDTEFYVADTHEYAKGYAETRCKEYLKGYEIINSEWRGDTYVCDYINNHEEFLVFQILELRGNFSVIRYHGFDGVDFEVLKEFDEEQEAKTFMKKAFKEESDGCEDCSDENQLAFDNGTEWIGFRIC